MIFGELGFWGLVVGLVLRFEVSDFWLRESSGHKLLDAHLSWSGFRIQGLSVAVLEMQLTAWLGRQGIGVVELRV